MRRRFRRGFRALLALLFIGSGVTLATGQFWRAYRPPPDFASLRYGDHPRQVLDVWQSGSAGSSPVLVYFHGGGFRGGDRRDVPAAILRECKQSGFAVVSVEYRLSQDAPYPAPMLDGARAVQYIRHHASELGIDPNRIALSGNSAGAGISLWVAFHDDLARPESDDLVSRQSTRVSCVAVVGAQSSYDPGEIREWIGGRAYLHPALPPFYGLSTVESPAASYRLLFREASPIHHLTADDPPVWMYYLESSRPLPADARPGQGIHHPIFGWKLRDQMTALGIPCDVRLLEDEPADLEQIDSAAELGTVAFVRRHFDDRPPASLASRHEGTD